MSQPRGLLRQILTNFLNTLIPKKYWGELKGTDYMGTDYYEGPENVQGHKRRTRWFVPTKADNFEQKIPPEWEAWLTHKRKEPPTEEEINFNRQKMKKTIENAMKLEASRLSKTCEVKPSNKLQFPKYDEYDSEFETVQKRKDQQ